MLPHIQLSKAHCVFCQQFIVEGERVAAVLGNPTVATLPFALPPHGHNFQYTTVYINGVDESCRLCRYPPCLTCSNSPKASILHVDCFKLAKSELLTATLSPRRLVELARSHPPAIPRSYVIAHTASVTDLGNIMRTLEELPPELRDMIASYCCESRWWRCLTIIAWLRQLANPLSRWTEAVQARLLCGFLYSTTETKLTSISMTLEEMTEVEKLLFGEEADRQGTRLGSCRSI